MAMLATAMLLMPAAAAGSRVQPTTDWPEIVQLRTGEWFSLGNHRFNATVSAQTLSQLPAGAHVAVNAEWRRSDSMPLDKAVFVRAGGSNSPVECRIDHADADSATVSFVPLAGESSYYVYYMPFSTCEYHAGTCRSHATVTYAVAGSNGSCTKAATGAQSVAAPVVATYQARAPFESFEPMGMPMTAAEMSSVLAAVPAATDFLVIPEHRELPVRLRSQLPARWVSANVSHPKFSGVVQPGENFTFQIAIFAPSSTVAVSGITFSDLVAVDVQQGPDKISASALRCMNLGGVDFWGRGFRHTSVAVGVGEVRSFWIAAVVPPSTRSGVYVGTATVAAIGTRSQTVSIQLVVKGRLIPNGGDDDVTRGTRLHWFDSKEGTEMDTVPAPFTALEVTQNDEGTLISMLGKRVTIGGTGLPVKIEAQRTQTSPWRHVLGAPVDFNVDGMAGLMAHPVVSFQRPTQMSLVWQVRATTSEGALTIDAEVDCTGYMSFNATISKHSGYDGATPTQAASQVAVNLTVPNSPRNAHFGMGLGRKGGLMKSFLSSDPASAKLCSWVVYDFGSVVTLDGIRLFSYGDGVHDAWHMYLQGAKSLPGGGFAWSGSQVTSFVGQASGGSEAHPKPLNQTFSFAPVTAQRWRWVVLDCHPSQSVSRSHVMVAEIEFHEAGSVPGVYMLNMGTRDNSLVVSSSGDGTPKNPAWQSVDGLIRYKSFEYGYDAVLRADLPDPPQPVAPPSNATTWHWNGMPTSGNGDNAVWVGSTSAGLRLYVKGDDPLWQAGVPFDSRASPQPPLSWYNNGTGGLTVDSTGVVIAFSGGHTLEPGHAISFAWSLLVTPVRPFNLSAHFQDRWAQLGAPGGDYTQYKEAGVTVVNMHQGNPVNPWINYPYLTNPAMKYAADTVHSLGMKYSVYNTMRELSDRCMELFPMISMNETLVQGPGGGADWLQEHLRQGFLPAWSDPIDTAHAYPPAQVPNPDPTEGDRLQDAAVRVKALSRWNNYYIAGIRQLMRDYSCDGIYLDEIAYDRVTMLRARKILGDTGVIDHHSDCGGFTRSPAVNYMELYPFINRLWYGEGFDYDTPSADYWLVEISGLPSGLSADLLRYTTMNAVHGFGRYHYRGMLVGSAFRYSGSGVLSPVSLWKLWDEFEIQDSEMIGWWAGVEDGPWAVPVKPSNSEFLATVYVQRNKPTPAALIVVADWSNDLSNRTVALSFAFNWTALGLSSTTTKLHVPLVAPFQTQNAGVFPTNQVFNISATQGGLLLIAK